MRLQKQAEAGSQTPSISWSPHSSVMWPVQALFLIRLEVLLEAITSNKLPMVLLVTTGRLKPALLKPIKHCSDLDFRLEPVACAAH